MLFLYYSYIENVFDAIPIRYYNTNYLQCYSHTNCLKTVFSAIPMQTSVVMGIRYLHYFLTLRIFFFNELFFRQFLHVDIFLTTSLQTRLLLGSTSLLLRNVKSIYVNTLLFRRRIEEYR